MSRQAGLFNETPPTIPAATLSVNRQFQHRDLENTEKDSFASILSLGVLQNSELKHGRALHPARSMVRNASVSAREALHDYFGKLPLIPDEFQLTEAVCWSLIWPFPTTLT